MRCRGRGPSRSVPAGEVVAQVRRLVENGYAEVVLTGVDITAYGGDLPGAMTLGMPRMSELGDWMPIKVFSERIEYTVRDRASSLAQNP